MNRRSFGLSVIVTSLMSLIRPVAAASSVRERTRNDWVPDGMYFDWHRKFGYTNDKVFCTNGVPDVAYGPGRHQVQLDGSDVTDLSICRLLTGPDGFIEYFPRIEAGVPWQVVIEGPKIKSGDVRYRELPLPGSDKANSTVKDRWSRTFCYLKGQSANG